MRRSVEIRSSQFSTRSISRFTVARDRSSAVKTRWSLPRVARSAVTGSLDWTSSRSSVRMTGSSSMAWGFLFLVAEDHDEGDEQETADRLHEEIGRAHV